MVGALFTGYIFSQENLVLIIKSLDPLTKLSGSTHDFFHLTTDSILYMIYLHSKGSTIEWRPTVFYLNNLSRACGNNCV